MYGGVRECMGLGNKEYWVRGGMGGCERGDDDRMMVL